MRFLPSAARRRSTAAGRSEPIEMRSALSSGKSRRAASEPKTISAVPNSSRERTERPAAPSGPMPITGIFWVGDMGFQLQDWCFVFHD